MNMKFLICIFLLCVIIPAVNDLIAENGASQYGLVGDKYGRRTYCPPKNGKGDCFEVDELPTTSLSRPKGPYDTKNRAAYVACEALVYDHLQCGKNAEAEYLIVEKGGKFYFVNKTQYLGESAKEAAPNISRVKPEVDKLAAEGYRIVGVAHNHPPSPGGSRTCFSMADKNNTTEEIDCYMVSCDTGDLMKVYRYVKNDQRAYKITDYGFKQVNLEKEEEYIYKCTDEGNDVQSDAVKVDKSGTVNFAELFASIDTSKMVEIEKWQIAFLKTLLTRGTPATDEEIAEFNSKCEVMGKEYKSAMKMAMDMAAKADSTELSKEEKTRIGDEMVRTLDKKFSEVFDLANRVTRLKEQALSRGLIAP